LRTASTGELVEHPRVRPVVVEPCPVTCEASGLRPSGLPIDVTPAGPRAGVRSRPRCPPGVHVGREDPRPGECALVL